MLRRGGQKGFTLIELLIVIAIVGILAAVAIPIYRSQQYKAKLSEVTQTLGVIASAVDIYYNETYTWPPACADYTAIRTSLGVHIPSYRATFATGSSPTVITATIQNISASNPTLDGSTITLIASTNGGGTIEWTWGGTLDKHFMPKR